MIIKKIIGFKILWILLILIFIMLTFLLVDAYKNNIILQNILWQIYAMLVIGLSILFVLSIRLYTFNKKLNMF